MATLTKKTNLHYNTRRYYDPINQMDLTGEIGLVGAGIGMGVDLALQLIENGGDFKCVNWTSVAVSGAMGAVGGGVLGRGIGLATGREMAQNAVVRKLYNNKLEDSPIDIGKYADMGTKIRAGLGGLGSSATAVIRASNTGGCGCE